jgi:Flp pilus assembly protein TadG
LKRRFNILLGFSSTGKSWCRPLFEVIDLFRRSDRGGALVETAFVLPILISIASGLFEFGILYTRDIAMTSAVGSAAHYASRYPKNWSTADPAPVNSIQGQAQQGSNSLFHNTDAGIQITYLNPNGTLCGTYKHGTNALDNAGCAAVGNLIQVRVNYTYTFITSFLKPLFPSGKWTLSPTAVMVEEY